MELVFFSFIKISSMKFQENFMSFFRKIFANRNLMKVKKSKNLQNGFLMR